MIYGIGVDLVQGGPSGPGDRPLRRAFFASGSSPAGKSPIATPGPSRGVYQFAQRFAAKEAFSKALGVGLRQGGIRWRDVEVLPNPMGKPEIQVTGRAAANCAGSWA